MLCGADKKERSCVWREEENEQGGGGSPLLIVTEMRLREDLGRSSGPGRKTGSEGDLLSKDEGVVGQEVSERVEVLRVEKRDGDLGLQGRSAKSQLRRVEGSEARLTHRFDASRRVPSANGLEKSLAEALLLLR